MVNCNLQRIGILEKSGTLAAAAPEFISVSPITSGYGTTVSWPTHQANDLGILAVTRHALGPADQAGWTRFAYLNDNGGTDTFAKLFWKIATSSSMPAETITGGNPSGVVATIIVFRGVDQTTPIGPVVEWEVQATGSPLTFSAITTVRPNTLVGLFGMDGLDANDVPSFSNWTMASLASITERFDYSAPWGGGQCHGMATGIKASAGSTGTGTVDKSPTTDQVASATFAIQPPL